MNYPLLTQDYPLTDALIAQYRRDGFVKLDNVITGTTLEAFRNSVAEAVATEQDGDVLGREKTTTADQTGTYGQLFIHRVNVWQRHPSVEEFAFSPRLANIAARLCGSPVRIWHDQALFKEPLTGSKTPWHQDAPYWPHENLDKQLSIWIALQDATVENGCMSFLPRTHLLGPKESVRLGDANPQGVYELAPEARGTQPVIHELKAGSATFHHGLCFHYAGPNRTKAMREAFVVIYMPDDTRYSGKPHLVTDNQGFSKGDILNGALFPKLSTAVPKTDV